MNIPIQIRTHEVDQLHEFVPKLVEELAQAEHPNTEEYRSIYADYVHDLSKEYPDDDSFAAWLSMPADEWRMLVSGLDRLDEGRATSLQSKLIRRLDDKIEEVQ